MRKMDNAVTSCPEGVDVWSDTSTVTNETEVSTGAEILLCVLCCHGA